ncbi:MAG: sensor histidine kinase [Longimicrobiales bacterium]
MLQSDGVLEEQTDRSTARIEALRALARSIANEETADAALRLIAERIRSLAGATAVAIERHGGADTSNVAIAWAGRDGASAADLNAEVEDADRVVIALGARNERIGAIVVWREPGATPVGADALEHLGDLASMAALALRRGQLEEQIRRMRAEQDQYVDAKFRFINGIGEELRNRLGAAAEYVQLLDTEGELTEVEQKYIAGSRRSIDAAVRLIKELVQLTRAETGRLVLTPEPIHIETVLRAAVRDYEITVREIGVAFDLVLPETLPVIETDLDQVRQILDNLLGNAVRYTPIGGRITVSADIRPGRRKTDPSKYVCVSVKDTGPGVGDSDLIFEEVYRIERRGGMPGFRLAISRRIARLLGGELTLETSAEAGSTFTLWLPGDSSTQR